MCRESQRYQMFCCIKWLIIIILHLGSFFGIRRYVKIGWTKLETSIRNDNSSLNGNHSCIAMKTITLWMMKIVFVPQKSNDSLDDVNVFASQKKIGNLWRLCWRASAPAGSGCSGSSLNSSVRAISCTNLIISALVVTTSAKQGDRHEETELDLDCENAIFLRFSIS